MSRAYLAKTDLFDRFSRHSPQAAVVSGPVAAVPQLRAGQLLGAGQQGLPRLFRQGLQLPGEELPHPVGQPHLKSADLQSQQSVGGREPCPGHFCFIRCNLQKQNKMQK